MTTVQIILLMNVLLSIFIWPGLLALKVNVFILYSFYFIDCGDEKVYKGLSSEVERRLPASAVGWKRYFDINIYLLYYIYICRELTLYLETFINSNFNRTCFHVRKKLPMKTKIVNVVTKF